MLVRILSSLLVSALFAVSFGAGAQDWHVQSDWVEGQHLQLRAHALSEQSEAGTRAWLAIEFLPEEGWHFYWENPGDTGLPTRIEWQPQALDTSEITWPAPKRADYQGFINYGYYDRTLLIQEVGNQALLDTTSEPLTAQVDYLICEEICIPGRAAIELDPTQREIADSENPVSIAKTAMPENLGVLDGSYDIGSGQFRANFALPGRLQSAGAVDFFPISQKLVQNRASPEISASDGKISVVQASAERLPTLPRQFSGLIQLEVGEQATWFEFSLPAAGGLITNSEPAAAAGISVITALVLAFLGGIILNLMPCVLPVLSLKAMHLLENRDDPSNRRLDALAYTSGIVLSFVVIALFLLGLRSGGEQVGWGFQLQNASFVAFLVCLMFLLGLAMSGFVELGSSITRIGNLLPAGGGARSKSFATGLLATLVATPCTAPFMGVAMGAALTMPTALALMVFVALGLGLAFPMLVIGFVPAAAKLLPRPGQWMVTVKELLAFPLYLTAIWLLWVYSSLAGSDAAAMLLAFSLAMVFALWLGKQAQRRNSRNLAAVSVVLLFFSLVAAPLVPRQATDLEQSSAAGRFEPALISAAVANGQPVFVNVTADWCISCKVNERVALRSREVEDFFANEDVLYIVADWTRADSAITEFLEQFGRSGVPLYLAYLPGKTEPQVLPQILTPATVIRAFES